MPRSDTFIEKDSSINEQIDRMRHAATRALFERKDCIIVASVSCIYGIGSKEDYLAMTFDVTKGQKIDRQDLIKGFVELHYNRNDLAFERGSFRVRGDVVELFPAHFEDRAWRIDLFGDEVEKIVHDLKFQAFSVKEQLKSAKVLAEAHNQSSVSKTTSAV